MLNIIMLIICILPIVYYIFKLKGFKITTKEMVIIALFAGLHFALSKIQFVHYPQGGGFNLFASLPILLIGILYGPQIGMTCGLVASLVTLIGGELYIVHPAQFLLDYILPTMLLGVSGMFGSDKKSKIFIGCVIAVILKLTAHVLSGCVYFADYAPKGQNPLIYSLIYNLTGEGVEAFLSSIIITIMPIRKLNKMINNTEVKRIS